MDKVECHNLNYDKLVGEVDNWKTKETKNVKNFLRDYELGKITDRTSTQGNLMRVLYDLKIGVEHLDNFERVGVEKFLEDLLRDNIKTKEKKPYALKRKVAILFVLGKYLEWRNPKNNHSNVLKIKIKIKRNDFETLTEEEVKKLIQEANSIQRKYFIAVMSSGGFRAEEFHNIRYSDIELPKGKEMFVKITIRNQFSKTQGRTISLYDKFVLSIVKKYLAQRKVEGIKPNEPVFKISYNTNRKWLKKFGLKVLGKNLHYHMFRHTSATRLSSKMNRQQLCVYFGWKFSSPMPDVYIQRAGVNMLDIDKQFENSEFEELQQKLESEKFENEKKIKELQKILQQEYDSKNKIAKQVVQLANDFKDFKKSMNKKP